jgi:hypothetical protein
MYAVKFTVNKTVFVDVLVVVFVSFCVCAVEDVIIELERMRGSFEMNGGSTDLVPTRFL